MKTQTPVVEYVEAALADHALIAGCLGSIRRILLAESPKTVARDIEAIRKLVQQLAHHFALEEKRIFPALQATHHDGEIPRSLTRLCAEHKQLLREAQILDDVLKNQSHNQKLSDPLLASIVNLLADLERHAAAEDELFTPLLREAR